MIDRAARERAIACIRAFLAGKLTGRELRELYPRTGDRGVNAIYGNELSLLESGMGRNVLAEAERNSQDLRRRAARWVLFLKSDLEYEWPAWPPVHPIVLAVFAFFTLGRSSTLWRERYKRSGDLALWPFIREGDVEAAVRQHTAGGELGSQV